MSKTRPATPTVAFIDQYCAQYRDLFHNVRHFEQFTALHLGLLAETRRKSLPRLGKTVHADPQALHHFLANAEWSVEALRQQAAGAAAPGAGRHALHPVHRRDGGPQEGAHHRLRRPPVHRQPAYAGQRRRLGQCLWRARHDDLPAALPRLQAPDPPQSGRCLTRASRNWPSSIVEELLALGLSLQRRLGRQPLRRERRVHQRAAPAGAAVCRRHPLQSRRLAAAGPARAPDPLASLRARLHRWEQRAALHPRDHLRRAPGHPLLPDHHRPRRPCRPRRPGIS